MLLCAPGPTLGQTCRGKTRKMARRGQVKVTDKSDAIGPMQIGVRRTSGLTKSNSNEDCPDSCPEVSFWPITLLARSFCGTCPTSRFLANDQRG
jgi:hypothetical protein